MTGTVALTWLVIGTSCQTPSSCNVRAFVEKNAWINYSQVAAEKQRIFLPDGNGKARRFTLLADRIDYLEAYGSSVNSAIEAKEK